MGEHCNGYSFSEHLLFLHGMEIANNAGQKGRHIEIPCRHVYDIRVPVVRFDVVPP